jgi:hypothetical protein
MTVFTALFLALCSAGQPTPLADLSNDAAELRELFNKDQGLVRMILILSPT